MKERSTDFPRKAYYSPREFAALVGIHPSTVLDQIHSGKLYAIKLSERIYRIPLAVVIGTLHPEEIGEPRFRQSPDIGRVIEEDRQRREAEEDAAPAARARRDARKAEVSSR